MRAVVRLLVVVLVGCGDGAPDVEPFTAEPGTCGEAPLPIQGWPASLAEPTPLSSMPGSDALAVCGLVAEASLARSGDPECFLADSCLQVQSMARAALDPNCATNQDFASCMATLGARCAREDGVLLALPEVCDSVRRCLEPARDARLAELTFYSRRRVCRSIAASLARDCAQPALDDDTCRRQLAASAATCVDDPGSDACGWTVGDALDCTAAASCGALAAGDVCAPLRHAATAPPADTPLQGASEAEVRAFCNDIHPGAWSECSANVDAEQEDRHDEETCVAHLRSLRCACEAGLVSGPGLCGQSLGQAVGCRFPEAPSACCEGLRCGPWPWEDGFEEVAVNGASTDQLTRFCQWKTCAFGGGGYVPLQCDHNLESATNLDVAGCVADVRNTFAACDHTLGELASCVRGMAYSGDACHRNGSFGLCRQSGDGQHCHTWLITDACAPLLECLAVPHDGDHGPH